jgi:hypothetical protein
MESERERERERERGRERERKRERGKEKIIIEKSAIYHRSEHGCLLSFFSG